MIKLSKEERGIIKRIQHHTDPIFFEPQDLLSYNEVILGKKVKGGKIIALESNTYRGFHKIDKDKPGAGTIYPEYFIANKERIITGLKKAKTTNDLDALLDTVVKGLVKQLKKNIDNKQLESYNKVRKPVDIVIEMLICLAHDFSARDRQRIIPLLRLPLDSWMFKSPLVFAKDDLRILAINRRFSFQNVKTKTHYKQLQGYISNRVQDLGAGLNPISLDLLWTNRYLRKGKNIAQLNGIK